MRTFSQKVAETSTSKENTFSVNTGTHSTQNSVVRPHFLLQQSIGNQAAQLMQQSNKVLPKNNWVNSTSPGIDHDSNPIAEIGSTNSRLQLKGVHNTRDDHYEREADQIAARVLAGGSKPTTAPLQVTPRVQAKSNCPVESIPASVTAAVSSGGRPLPGNTRDYFETRFGHDFSAVRVHDSSTAGKAARQIHAKAFTLGQHIAFAAGAYQPHTHAGKRLIAHELSHTLQQQAVNTLQREADEPAITARDIFPVEEGTRLQVLRTMPDVWLDILRSQDQATAQTFEALENRIAEVTTVTDDVFEALISGEVQVSTAEGEEPRTVTNVRIRLARVDDGTFTLQISGEQSASGTSINLYSVDELSVSRDDVGIVLSRGGVPQFRTSRVEGGGVSLGAYTAPYLNQVPAALRSLAPERLELIEMRSLPEVEAGSSEETAALEANAARTRARTSFRNQRLMLGSGLLAGDRYNPLLQAGWQINFRPFDMTGGFVQFPLRLSIQYAPTSSVIGRLTSGFEASLSQLRVPINVQLITGIAGGRLDEMDLSTGISGPPRAVFGLPFGAGVGLELNAFRMDLRYDYLVNLIEGSPNLHTVSLQLGGAF